MNWGKKMIFANIQNKGISRRPARKITFQERRIRANTCWTCEDTARQVCMNFFFYTSIVYVNFQDYNYFKRNKQLNSYTHDAY